MSVEPDRFVDVNKSMFEGKIHGKIEILEEWFHPAGPVIYTTCHDVEFVGYPSRFDIVDRNELRRV